MNKGLRNILVGAAPLATLELLSLGLAFVTLPYLMKVLGAASFGRYAFGTAAAGMLTIFVDYGFGVLGAKEAARSSGTARARLFWSLQATKALLAVLGLSTVAALSSVPMLYHGYGDALTAAAPAALSALVFPQWFLQGALRLRTLAASLATARAAIALATFAFVAEPADAALAVALQALTGALAGLFALTDRGYRSAVAWHAPAWVDCSTWLRQGRALFVSTLAVSAYSTSVPLLLGMVAGPSALGLFSAGDKIRAAMQALLAPLGTAAFPHFSRWLHIDRARGYSAARRMLALQLGLALPLSTLAACGAAPALAHFVGVEYRAAVPAAQLLAFCLVCTAVSNTLGMQVMLGLDMDRAFTSILVCGAVFGLSAVAWCGWRWQATGAAGAVLATEALVALLMAAWLRHRGVLQGIAA